MRRLSAVPAALRDLARGPGPFGERVERNAATLIVAVLALALVLRLCFLAVFHEDLYSRNEKGFTYPALNLIAGDGMGFAKDCPSSGRAPLYILFLAPFHAAFGADRYAWPLGLAQVVVSVLNVYLVYRIGKEWRSAKVGLLGALIMAVYPYNLYHDIQYYLTFLFTFFMLLAVWGFLRTERTRDWREGALTGVWLGLAMLATSGPMVFFAPLASLWLWRRWGDLRLAAKRVAVIAGMTLLVMTPWIYRNWRVHRAFVPMTLDGGRVFYKSYNDAALGMLLTDRHPDDTPEPEGGVVTSYAGIGKTGCGFLGMSEVENDRYWKGLASDWVRAHPAQVPALVGVRFAQLWRPWLWTPKEAVGSNGAVILSAAFMNWGYALSYGFILVFGALEWLLSTRGERKRTWLFVLLAVAFSLTYSITHAMSKYRVPFDSVLALMAAAALWRAHDAYRLWRRK